MSIFEHFIRLTTTDRAIIVAYVVVMALLSMFGVHRYALARIARRRPTRSAVSPPLPAELPMVTVQLPIFNERFVVERLLEATADLDWPMDRLQIQVLDDSTDATVALTARLVEILRARGHRIEHVLRRERTGFKAGALANGLRTARGELIAIFDADFVPPRGFLRAVVGHFQRLEVGLVQGRWGHLNREATLLTRLQALLLDGHFFVDQNARSASGMFFNFNGTGGIWRRAAIDAAGGWQADTLTEDLDLSYRAQLAGWKFVYRHDVVAPAELPADMNAYKSQQHRWAKGSAQTFTKLVPRLFRASIARRNKLEALFHLTGNFTYPLVLLLALLVWPALDLRYRYGWSQTLLFDLPFFVLGTLSVIASYRLALPQVPSMRQRIALIPALLALGVGISVSNTRAVLAGLIGHRSEFRRTPKAGDADADTSREAVTHATGRYTIGVPGWVLVELVLGIHFVFLTARAFGEQLYLSIPFLALFASGFLAVAAASLGARLDESAWFQQLRQRPSNATMTLQQGTDR